MLRLETLTQTPFDQIHEIIDSFIHEKAFKVEIVMNADGSTWDITAYFIREN